MTQRHNRLRRRSPACMLVVVIAGVHVSAPARSEPVATPVEKIERRVGVMGTDLQIKLIGEDRGRLVAAVDAAEAELRRVEDMMTDWRASPLTRLNAAAGRGPRVVPSELLEIIARGIAIGRLTGGAFDISYAGVGRLWKFKTRPPRVPTRSEIETGLSHVGSDRIVIDSDAGTVDLPSGMRVGLGGIAKGFGVDRAMQVLLDHGIDHGIVNAGGDLKALGRDGDAPWEIAVKHPRDRAQVIAVLRVSNSAMVTSGDYERFFEHQGRRYHHILDPRTGYPSQGAMSATVLAPSAEFADALATALCVMGPETGMPLIERLRRVEAIVIDMAGEPHASTGLQTSLR